MTTKKILAIGAATIFTCTQLYVHPNRSTRSKNQVKVLLCRTFYSPIYVFLCGNSQMPLETTLNSNIATWNKAYSVFPSLTFGENVGYITSPLNEDVVGDDWNRRIAAAGYRIKDISWYPKHTHPSIARRRRFGDKHSCIIDLPTQGITASHVPDGAIASLTFGLTIKETGTDVAYRLQMGKIALPTHVLRHRYVIQCSAGSAYDKKIRFLQKRLQAQTFFEFSKLPVADLPPLYKDNMRALDLLEDDQFWKSFTKPSWWTYYDDDVIEHLDRLEAELGEEESKVKMPWEA
jgi:hypothetical protein